MNSIFSVFVLITMSLAGASAFSADVIDGTWLMTQRICSNLESPKDALNNNGRMDTSNSLSLRIKTPEVKTSAILPNGQVVILKGEILISGPGRYEFRHENGVSSASYDSTLDLLTITSSDFGSGGSCPAGASLKSTFKRLR